MKSRIILIDDESIALARLQRLLKVYEDEIEIVGQAKNGAEGKDLVETLRPDVIFLDIEMPVLTGFEMLASLQYMPQVVFATAFDAYAIRAFEENSIDYLLKPIEAERLEITMQKLRKQKQENPPIAQEIAQLLAKIQPAQERAITSISVKIGDRILLIRLAEISHFEAEDKYIYLYTLEGKKHLLDNSLTTIEEKLPAQFVRISRSAILNTDQVKEMQKFFNGKYTFTMQDAGKTKLTSGSSFAEKIRKAFDL